MFHALFVHKHNILQFLLLIDYETTGTCNIVYQLLFMYEWETFSIITKISASHFKNIPI